jgi:hypothetical protein
MKFPWYIWIPRILLILVCAFMALMSFDIFEGNPPIGKALLGLLMHNLPMLLLVVILILTWKSPLWAGIIFANLAVGLIVFFGYSAPRFSMVTILVTSVPLIVAADLYFAAHMLRNNS